ncbi:hypothetical protein D3C84_1250400 [compost metagenome]
MVDPQCLSAVGGEQGAGDTQQDGHDPAHAVVARLDEAGQQADDEADEDGSNDAHGNPSAVNMEQAKA